MLKLGGLAYLLAARHNGESALDRVRFKLREKLEKKAAGNVPPITSNITAGAPRPPTPAVPGVNAGANIGAGFSRFNTGAPPQRMSIGPKPPSSLHLPMKPPPMRSAPAATAGFVNAAKTARPASAAGRMVRTAVKIVA